MPPSVKRRVSAEVNAAPHFADCLLAVHAFMVEQDAASAPARLAQLKRDLREMKTLLAWSPASGRPARFLRPNSAQASMRLAAVQQLAQSAGLANALIHRDYHRLGAVHVRLEDDALVVSNPGGLVDGVTLANLLVTEPRPRNRALADAMKRIGVVERSGRGVDTIYRGMLKFGRSAPDYTRTDAQNVVLRMPTEPADLEFRRLVVDEERRRNAELPIDSLIALGALRQLKRLSAEELAQRIQRDAASAKRTLEALTEAGFVEAHGATRGRTYRLSAAVYGAVADKAAYTRQAGFSPIQNEQMVLSYVRQHGRIKRAEATELCRLSEGQVKALLKRMCQSGLLTLEGAGPASFYRIGASDRMKLDEIQLPIRFGAPDAEAWLT